MQAKLLEKDSFKVNPREALQSHKYLAESLPLDGCLEESLPHPHRACATADALEYTPLLSPTTALVTGDLAGSMRPNDGSLMAMPEFLIEDAGSVPYSDGEQDHTLKKHSKAGRWPHRYLLPISELPVKDDHLQGVPLGIASPNCLTGHVHTPWNDITMSSYPHLPLLKDDGTPRGLHVSGFALHGDGEQCHTLDGALKAEQGTSKYCVPLGYLPTCRNSPRRKRRRFTNGEKAVISYKRKVGVCGDCRQAKRKASLGMTSAFFC